MPVFILPSCIFLNSSEGFHIVSRQLIKHCELHKEKVNLNLLQLIRRDRKAIRLMVDSYGDSIYNLCFNYLRSDILAEELTQDVFVSFLEALPTFRKEASLKTFLYKIAINRCLDYLKSEKRRKSNEESAFSAIQKQSSRPREPIHLLESKEQIAIIRFYISQLPEAQKTALTLVRLESFSIDDTAKFMNISYKAVESLLSRAKLNLKNFLESEQKFDGFAKD